MGKAIKITVRKDSRGTYMTSIDSSNGNILLTGHGYNTKAAAKKTLNSVIAKIKKGEFVIEDKKN